MGSTPLVAHEMDRPYDRFASGYGLGMSRSPMTTGRGLIIRGHVGEEISRLPAGLTVFCLWEIMLRALTSHSRCYWLSSRPMRKD
jgi:hypothetical protein